MELLTQMLISGILSAALSIVAYKLRMLTFTGALASLFVGYVVGVFGSIFWLLLLIAFTAAGLAATRMNIYDKKQYDLQEGDTGERSHLNVLGVGIPPCLMAFLYGIQHTHLGGEYDLAFTIAFITTLAVAAADTVASEIGVKDKKVWLITTFERVRRGTNGGVSVTGTLASIAASAFTALVGWLLIFGFDGLNILILIPIAMGFLGNVLDSVFGASFERKGKMSKYANNCISALIAAMLGMLLVLYIF
jgi:uncharacterized protein (TIGR00297 family)